MVIDRSIADPGSQDTCPGTFCSENGTDQRWATGQEFRPGSAVALLRSDQPFVSRSIPSTASAVCTTFAEACT